MVNGQKIDLDHKTLEFAHGQWSELTNFDHLTTETLKFWSWSWSEMTTVISKFWPWSWSKIFDHLTMTPGRRPNGQQVMVIYLLVPPRNDLELANLARFLKVT